MKQRTLSLTLIVLMAVALTACRSPYYLVESRLVESSRGERVPDVTETAMYQTVRKEARQVAIRPPDVCADQGVAVGGGEEKLAAGVLRTRCGVEMAEFERALAKNGYDVISWGAINYKAERERIAPRRAAEELNVDVLLQVNALERTTVTPGRDARWERSYYHSSKHRDRGKPAEVDGARRETFEQLIDAEESRLLLNRQSATVNASAVLVSTGSTFWFYEATLLHADSAEPVVALLLYCTGEGCKVYQEEEPEAAQGPSSGSIKAVSVGSQNADEEQVVYRELIRELLNALVKRFARGGS